MSNLPVNLATFNLIANGNKRETRENLEIYRKVYNIKMRNVEIRGINKLISNLNISTSFFEGFYIGYTIPQISKEFDLLRLEKNRVINIELKTKADKLTIYKQLLQNRYYLSSLEREIELFSYIEKTNSLYKLENLKLVEVDFQILRNLLKENLEEIQITNINKLFNPSNFLVSPFNETDKFLEGNYFLTSHQEYIKKISILGILRRSFKYYYIEGSSGTGKTLLIYDIVKSLKALDFNIGIIHVGQLNMGHEKLIDNNWNIYKITDLDEVLYSKYDILVIDEAQRLEMEQVDKIISYVENTGIYCIFSLDPRQVMGRMKDRDEEQIYEYIKDKIGNSKYLHRDWALTTTIRSNVEVEEFIKNLFNRRKYSKDDISFENIVVNYFNDIDELKNFGIYLNKYRDCEIINYTVYGSKDPLERLNIEGGISAHSIIGQEFNRVFLNLDENFKYDDNGKLTYEVEGKQPYYDPIQMAYQIGTRAKNKLYINILNNMELYRKCLKIISR